VTNSPHSSRITAAKRQPPPPSPQQLRIAASIAAAVILFAASSLPLWAILKRSDLWPGWFAFSLVVLAAGLLVGWAVTGAASASHVSAAFRFLTLVIAGVAALVALWLALAELGTALGMEMASAFRFSLAACLAAAVASLLLAVFRHLPDSLPTLLALELAVFVFGLTVIGLTGIGLSLLKPWLAIEQGPFTFLFGLVGLALTYLLAVRRFFVDHTRDVFRFASTWSPAVLGSIFAASALVHLLFAVELRTSPSEERILLSVNNAIPLTFLLLLVWMLVFRRGTTVLRWVALATAAAVSIVLVDQTRADRRAVTRVSEVARQAAFDQRSQRYEEALRKWREVLDVRQHALPRTHHLVGEALAGVGNALNGLGQAEDAIDALSAALEIAEASSGSPDLRASLLRAKIALSRQRLGEIEEADAMLAHLDPEELLSLPAGEFELGSMLANVGDAYRKTARFAEAELLYRRAVDVVNEAPMRDYDAIYVAKSGLVRVLLATARFEEARAVVYDLRALMTHKYRPLFMSDCYQLEAEIEGSLEHFSTAVRLQKEALRILVDELGMDHPDTAAALRDLGTYLLGAGYPGQALEVCRNARTMVARKLGAESPEVVKADYALACVLSESSRPREAAPLFQDCIERWRELYGDDFELISEARHGLARAHAALGEHRAASLQYSLSLESAIDNLEVSLAVLSDQQQVAALRRVQQRATELILHTSDHHPDDTELVRRCFDAWLRIKGALLEAQRARGESLAHSANGEAAEISERLLAVDRKLASLWFEGRPATRQFNEVAELRKSRRDLETRLNSLLAESGIWATDTSVTSQTVRDHLPPGSTYVDFCWARTASGADRYLAFVLPAGSWSEPRLVDLGSAEEVHRALVEHFVQMAGQHGDGPRLQSGPTRLYDAIIRPLLPSVGDSAAILISPDGALARLPFAAVIQPTGEYLDERFEISYLSSGRDLALWQKARHRKLSAIIIADPDFDCPRPVERSGEGVAPANRGTRRSSWLRPRFRDVYLQPLPGTRTEAEGIARLLETRSSFDVLLFTDVNASEDSLAFIESPWLMHLATHGFFFPPDRLVPPRNLPASMVLLGSGGLQANPDDNPMARAGLALAGANTALQGGDEWGLLTLDEIMAMPLLDTEMVVVSACESGIGEIEQGEGVFGVGRAFLAAGAQSVLVTLWSVADEPTAELMQEFYRLWLAGRTKAEALRQAQSTLRRDYPSPAIWAPFILVGDPS
jgi:CHAT domain-containing protein/tetratricopeptide (TPR) repeat protein